MLLKSRDGRRRLKLTNNTAWDTNGLRKLMLAAMKEKGVTILRVEFDYSRQGDVCGEAYVSSTWMRIFMPSPKYVEREDFALNKLWLAQVISHEIDHCLGLNHKDMLPANQLKPTFHEGLLVAWSPVEKKAALPKGQLVAQRAEHAREMLKKADTRLKRAKTIQAKWAKKVKYYEKRGKK